MAKKKKELINLLPQEEFAASTLGRILTWLLSTFRMIVIATEMIVMAAFLSRFWLDARNTDLNDEIKQKTAIISSYRQIERDFRDAQTKLSLLSGLTSAPTQNSLLSGVSEGLPIDVSLTTFSVESGSTQIAGLSLSEQSVAQFIANLGLQKSLVAPSLTQLTSDKNGNGLIFLVKSEEKK